MAKVLGIGGVFFKAADPKAVAAWYARVLGLAVEDWGGAVFPPHARGQQVWTPFPADTDYFAPSDFPLMINLMVDDLDGVLAKAAGEGVEPLDRRDDAGYGRFAWLIDPAGVKVELWEPAPDAPTTPD
jgi:predicted enzyme related to lactoylglutathione lyase